MPKVGNKMFAYTKKGEQQAAAIAKRTGNKVVVTKAKKKG